MAAGKQLTRLALFGQPVAASLSPAIHRQFADQCGLQIEYRAIEAGVDEFPRALEEFRRAGGEGCNVTLPLKQAAWQLATRCSQQADEAQAANTLVQRPGGWHAHNTDGIGCITDLHVNNGIETAGRRVAVLGAGGAVAGILGVLLASGPARLVLVNRDLERARSLAASFAGSLEVEVCAWADLASAGGFDLLLNATSLGHAGKAPPLAASAFAPGAVCYDLNYGRAAQPLRAWCESAGQSYLDGLGMLVEQAAESFLSWTGQRPDSRPVIESLRTGLD